MNERGRGAAFLRSLAADPAHGPPRGLLLAAAAWSVAATRRAATWRPSPPPARATG